MLDVVRRIAIVFTFVASTAHAGVVNVSTTVELEAAIGNAQAGDEIVIAAGTYALTGASCTANGSEAQPIVVRAATPGAVVIQMDALEGFKVSGAHWHFEGLEVRGVCAVDSNCEHAFHVTGAADGFVLRMSRVIDFNAQLKVNAAMVNGSMVMPNNGLVEYNEVGDTRGRDTANPVTKLNIDTGNDWIVRGNYLHDAYKLQGDGVSYASFMKSGGKRGLYERNLVICSKDTTGGTRIGLSFGGGGTAPQFCAPAYDANTPCSVEHEGGTMRNNIIVNCSDVGVYLNRAKDSHVLFNTLIATTGVDFRFDTTSGEAVGNLLAGMIRARDLAQVSQSGNLMGQTMQQFTAWYRAPLDGDLAVVGDVSALIGSAPMRTDVRDDYCGAMRPAGALTMGALEHSVTPQCETTRPPVGTPADPTGDGGFGGDDSNGGGPPGTGGGGCCQAQQRPDALAIAIVALGLFSSRRARRPRRG
jgi:hypothetical protein